MTLLLALLLGYVIVSISSTCSVGRKAQRVSQPSKYWLWQQWTRHLAAIMPILPQVAAAVALSQRSVFEAPLKHAHFNLDTSGVAGVFGGEEAVSAMTTVHIYKHRKWLGWYNSPGSYEVARRYGRLAKSKFFHGLFPGVHTTDPATLFGLDGMEGPKFIAAHSGTALNETSHLAALFMKQCADERPVKKVDGRMTQPVGVTVVKLHHIPNKELTPVQSTILAPVYASVPISVSVGTCVTSALSGDWYAFAMILLGILASGFSCLVIGSGTFLFTRPVPAEGSPSGNGILVSDKNIVLLQGDEAAVNAITRGRFSLKFDSEPHYSNIGWCSVFLMVQFVAQLLLIPQATLFGQIMFILSLAVSWAYNLSLSLFDKEAIQIIVMKEHVLDTPKLTKYEFGTRTSMAVFSLLVLEADADGATKIINVLLPNDTKVWRKWKSIVINRITSGTWFEFDVPEEDFPKFNIEETLLKTFFDAREETLLNTLLNDTRDAYRGFRQYQLTNEMAYDTHTS